MLTNAQLLTLKAAIEAESDPTFLQAIADGNTPFVANWFNQASNPAFVVWRTSVTQDEIMQNGFDWTRVDNLSVGKSRIWEWLFSNEARSFNPSKLNVRAGIDAVWVGTAADLAQRAAVYVHCKRPATRGEKLYATGTGTDAVPGTLKFEGDITVSDVVNAQAM
jgi:hypothetical protein